MSEDLFRWIVAAAVVISAAAFLLEAFLVLGLYRSFKEIQKRVAGLTSRAEPILDSARSLVDETRPKVAAIAGEAAEISRMAKVEMVRITELVNEISDRARIKVASVDAALDDAAGDLQHAATSVRHAVLRPLREVNGLLNGVRAALATLVYGRQESVDRVTQDEEMFI